MARKLHNLQFWQRCLKIIMFAMLGLIFSLGVHLLPADSRIIPQNPTPPTAPLPLQGEGLGVGSRNEQLMEQGKTLYQAGQLNQAAESFQQAAKFYASQKDALNQALALNYLSLVQQKLGRPNQATQAIATSLNLLNSNLNTSDAKHVLALVYNTQGSLQLALGQPENAVESWQKAANTYSEIGDRPGHTGSLINQATALQSLGLYRRTMKIFQQVEQSLQALPNSPLKAAGLRSLGNALLASGDIQKSQKALEQSLAVANQLPSPEQQSATLLSLGNAAFALGNSNLLQDTTTQDNPLPQRCGHTGIPDKAKTSFQQAVELYQKSATKSTSPITTIQAQLNRLNVLQELDQKPSIEELDSIESALTTLTPSRAAVYARVNFAQSLVCLSQGRKGDGEKSFSTPSKIQNPKSKIQNPSEIVEILNTAVAQAQDLKDQRAESYALGNLGQVYEQTKQWAIARRYTESALNLAQIINSPDIAYQWQWQLGRLLFAQGDSPAAVAAYTSAVDTLKSLRGDLVALNPDIQFDFRDEVEPVYRQLVALLLQRKEVTQKNLKQARNVIETLQLAELDNFFRDACITVQPTPIDEIVDNANLPTAVFYPIILPDRLEVIVKLPRQDELRHYTTFIDKSQVETKLEDLRQKLEERYTFRDREILSQEVYNWIVQPFEKQLQQKVKNLVFVLDGALRNIPVAALFDGKQYLVEKYSVALSPGLQLHRTKQKRKRYEALTAGLTQGRLGFSPLPNVANELQEIKSIVPSKELVNQAFTESSIENQVSSVSYPVVHLATHGKFSSKVEDTFVLAWNGKINVKELRELLQTREQVVGRSSRVPPPIELLVLSACETATGDKRAALGLAGVAVRSGARSTLASLWQVDDKSTSILMGEFYRQLTQDPNITKSEALRRAQQFILQKYKEHPFYWAPYVLVGNWL